MDTKKKFATIDKLKKIIAQQKEAQALTQQLMRQVLLSGNLTGYEFERMEIAIDRMFGCANYSMRHRKVSHVRRSDMKPALIFDNINLDTKETVTPEEIERDYYPLNS